MGDGKDEQAFVFAKGGQTAGWVAAVLACYCETINFTMCHGRLMRRCSHARLSTTRHCAIACTCHRPSPLLAHAGSCRPARPLSVRRQPRACGQPGQTQTCWGTSGKPCRVVLCRVVLGFPTYLGRAGQAYHCNCSAAAHLQSFCILRLKGHGADAVTTTR